MDIIIKETGEIKTLTAPAGHPDGAIPDIIGNDAGFGDDFDGSIVIVNEAGDCITSQDNFDWWQEEINSWFGE